MLSVQVRSRSKADEELTAVGARTAVGHGQDTLAGVYEGAVEFVLEFGAVDGRASTAGTGWVTTLDHEAGDDSMEDDVVVLAGVGEGRKVFACLHVVSISVV